MNGIPSSQCIELMMFLKIISQIYSPAELRQQTEELCAAIDEVLQDPLSTVLLYLKPQFISFFPPVWFLCFRSYYLPCIFFQHQRDSSPSSLQNLLASDAGKVRESLLHYLSGCISHNADLGINSFLGQKNKYKTVLYKDPQFS